MIHVLGEVHDLHAVSVDGDGARHGGRGAVLGAQGRGVRALPRIVLLLYQVVAGPESHKMSIVGWGWDGDGSGAPDVGVAQLIGQLLQFISLKPVIIPEYVVVGWSAGPLDSLVGAQVEVELGGVSDPDVHGGPRRNVA